MFLIALFYPDFILHNTFNLLVIVLVQLGFNTQQQKNNDNMFVTMCPAQQGLNTYGIH